MAALRNAALLALLGLLCLSAAATGQSLQCGDRDTLLEALERRYSERVVGRGVTQAGALFEILAAPSGSWSVLVTTPRGTTCVVSTGEGWRSIDLEEDDPEA